MHATSITWRIVHDVVKPTNGIELGPTASTVRVAGALQGKPQAFAAVKREK
jgi:hypothetical protein